MSWWKPSFKRRKRTHLPLAETGRHRRVSLGLGLEEHLDVVEHHHPALRADPGHPVGGVDDGHGGEPCLVVADALGNRRQIVDLLHRLDRWQRLTRWNPRSLDGLTLSVLS